jgi:malonyl-ACP O-methyltransferase BioC
MTILAKADPKGPISVNIVNDIPNSNSNAAKHRFGKAVTTYTDTNMMGKEIAKRLTVRLGDMKRDFTHILNLGAGDGTMTDTLLAHYPSAHVIQADISEALLNTAPIGENITNLVMDAEVDFPLQDASQDMVISNLLLPWVSDAPQLLFRAGKVLKKDGLFHASTLGHESFSELRYAFSKAEEALGLKQAAHTMNFPDVQSVGKAMQTVGYAIPVIDKDTLRVDYPDVYTLFSDLKMLGATCIHEQSKKGLTTPRLLRKVAEIYASEFGQADGSIPVTLEIIYMHGWKPDRQNQPQPLKRGSAKNSLADALTR